MHNLATATGTTTLEINQNYLPLRYKSYLNSPMFKLTKVTDTGKNPYSFLYYTFSWNIKHTFYSSGVIRMDYKNGPTVISSIHFILHDSQPSYYQDFLQNQASVITSNSPISASDSQIFAFTPKLYFYHVPLNRLSYAYEGMLNNLPSNLNNNNCLLPYYEPTVTTNESLYSNPYKITNYLWIPEPLATDSTCSSSINKGQVFYFYFYGLYDIKILQPGPWNSLQVNTILATQTKKSYYNQVMKIQFTASNDQPVYSYSTPGELYSSPIIDNMIIFEEKPNYQSSSYIFKLTIDNPLDQLKSTNFSLQSVETTSDNIYMGTISKTLVLPTSSMLTYSTSTDVSKLQFYVNCVWYPQGVQRYSQTFIFTFDDNGTIRKKSVNLCVGARCRYGIKNISIDVMTNSACGNTVYNPNTFSTYYSACLSNKNIILKNSVNIDSSSVIFKMGSYNLKYTYNSSTNQYTITLPNNLSSGCVPLMIYNTCAYNYSSTPGYCSMGARIQYFFTFNYNSAITLTRVTPYLLDAERIQTYSLSLTGTNLSHDLRCFLMRNGVAYLELQYIQNSLNGGCILDISLSNQPGFLNDVATTNKYCIALRYKKFTNSGALTTENPSCTNTQTSCIPVYFTKFSKNVVTYTFNNQVINPLTTQTNGHELGGYGLDITISNLQYTSNSLVTAYSAVFIFLSSLIIQFGNMYTYKIGIDNEYYNLVNPINISGSSLKFTFIIPPQVPVLDPAVSPVNSYNIKVSINDGWEYLPQTLIHTYVGFGVYGIQAVHYRTSTPTPCPVGYFCPSTPFYPLDPLPCGPGTYRASIGGYGCSACEISRMCPIEAMSNSEPCYPGFMCLSSKTIFPTRLCPGGFVCTSEVGTNYARWDKTQLPLSDPSVRCPAGYFCEEGTTTAKPVSFIEKAFGDASLNMQYSLAYNPLNNLENINESFTWSYPNAFYVVHNGIQIGNLFIRSHTPVQCLNSFDCLNSATRIWGQGKCPLTYFCPLPVKRTELIKKIVKYDDYFECYTTQCMCPRGYFCPSRGMTEPIICTRGSYQDEMNQASCKPCEPGFYCPTEGMVRKSQRRPCLPGYACPARSWMPIPCNVDYYQDTMYETSCKECVEGKECSMQATANPVICSAGMICEIYQDHYRRILCPAGFYCPAGMSKKSDAKICPVGYYCPIGTGWPISCREGTYQPYRNQGSCLPCPKGFYCPLGGMTTPRKCEQGKYCSKDGLTVPDGDCDRGYICVDGTSVKADQLDQYRFNITIYSDDLNFNEIYWPLKCPKGYMCLTGTGIQNNTVALVPNPCGLNSFQYMEGSFSCLPCTPGHQCLNSVNIYQELCPPGFYRSQSQIQCTPCPKGTYLPYNPPTPSTDPKDCRPCEAGYICPYQNISDYSQFPCDSGYICEAGKFGYLPEMICPTGYFCNRKTISFRKASENSCPAGRYCPLRSQADDISVSMCKKIKAGNYTIPGFCLFVTAEERYFIKSQGDDFDCQSQFMYPQEINKLCYIGNPCPKNYYCPPGSTSFEGSNPPKPCPEGTYSPYFSYEETHCMLGFITRYVNNYIEIQMDDKYLYPTTKYLFTFNKKTLENIDKKLGKITLGRDYDIVFEFTLEAEVDSKNKDIWRQIQESGSSIEKQAIQQSTTYLLENESRPPMLVKDINPFMKVPLMYNVFYRKNFTDIRVSHKIYLKYISNFSFLLCLISKFNSK